MSDELPSVFDFTEAELLRYYGSPQPIITRRRKRVIAVKYEPTHRLLDWRPHRG